MAFRFFISAAFFIPFVCCFRGKKIRKEEEKSNALLFKHKKADNGNRTRLSSLGS